MDNPKKIEMVRKNRARLIQEYLEKIDGEISKNKLVERIEKDGLMSHQTANDAIDEAVNSGMIIRREKMRGKLKIVYLTAHAKYVEFEQSHLDNIEKLLIQFDEKFDSLRKMYSELSLEEKAYVMEGFFLLHVHFHMALSSLHQKFEKTRKWSNLLHEVRSRHDSLSKLVSSGGKKEHAVISTHILEGKLMYVNDMIKKMDEYLNELKKN